VPISGKKVVKILFKKGFIKVSQSGSHLKLRKGTLITIVPLHKNKDLPKGTIKSIEKQTGVKIL